MPATDQRAVRRDGDRRMPAPSRCQLDSRRAAAARAAPPGARASRATTRRARAGSPATTTRGQANGGEIVPSPAPSGRSHGEPTTRPRPLAAPGGRPWQARGRAATRPPGRAARLQGPLPAGGTMSTARHADAIRAATGVDRRAPVRPGTAGRARLRRAQGVVPRRQAEAARQASRARRSGRRPDGQRSMGAPPPGRITTARVCSRLNALPLCRLLSSYDQAQVVLDTRGTAVCRSPPALAGPARLNLGRASVAAAA